MREKKGWIEFASTNRNKNTSYNISEFDRFNPILDADAFMPNLNKKILNVVYKVGTCDMLNFPFFACENFMSDSGHK